MEDSRTPSGYDCRPLCCMYEGILQSNNKTGRPKCQQQRQKRSIGPSGYGLDDPGSGELDLDAWLPWRWRLSVRARI